VVGETATPQSTTTTQADTATRQSPDEADEDTGTTQATISEEGAASDLVPLSVGNASITTDLFQTARNLNPEDGLMVACSTIAETIDQYWQAAVALGSVAAILLWIGLWKREAKDEDIDPSSKS